jgi:uncharacterized coiled-coil DUF342 family protein
MSELDLKINAKVRKILTEYNIDVSILRISSASGSVSIRGELKKLMGSEFKENEVGKLIAVLETVMLRTKNVKRVIFEVKGWTKRKGKWQQQEEEKEQETGPKWGT